MLQPACYDVYQIETRFKNNPGHMIEDIAEIFHISHISHCKALENTCMYEYLQLG